MYKAGRRGDAATERKRERERLAVLHAAHARTLAQRQRERDASLSLMKKRIRLVKAGKRARVSERLDQTSLQPTMYRPLSPSSAATTSNQPPSLALCVCVSE